MLKGSRSATPEEMVEYLRDNVYVNEDEWNLFGPYSSPKEVDAAIDAAMKEKRK